MLETLRAYVHHNRKDVIVVVLLLLICSILFAPMMHHWRLMGDYTVHNNLAYALTENVGEFFRNTPHFLYHVFTAASLLLIPGGDVYVAGVRVMVISYLVLMLLIYWQIRTASHLPDTRFVLALTGAVTLGLMLVAPINFFTPDNLYFGYFVPHVYHNPTVNLMKPFALALFIAGLSLYTAKEKLAWWWMFPYALLTALCLVSKPSFILSYVPVLGLVTAYFMLKHLPQVWQSRADDANISETIVRYVRTMPVNWPVLMGGIVIPSFAILLYQAMTWTSSGGISFEPLRVFQEWTLHYEPNADKLIVFKLVMSVAFPLLVYSLHIQKTIRDLMFNTAWLIFLISVAYAYLLVDNTVIAAGDFGWGAQMGALLMYIVAMVYLFKHYEAVLQGEALTQTHKIILAICALVFILHVISGLWWYWLNLTNGAIDLIYGAW